jgi:hypothetical protein
LCYKSAQEFTQQDHQLLQTYAQEVSIPNPQKLSAKQLCVELARNLEQYLNTVKTQPTLNCQNDSTLEGDEFSEISNEFTIQDDMGYCFTKAEILKLKKHPYINLAWDQIKVKGVPIQESPAFSNMKTNNINQMLSSRKTGMSVESLRVNELVDLINSSSQGGNSTKYLNPSTIEKYSNRSADRNKIIKSLSLNEMRGTDLYREPKASDSNLSYLNWVTELISYLIKVNDLNKETAKYLLIDLFGSN